jgi:hypothetical protein
VADIAQDLPELGQVGDALGQQPGELAHPAGQVHVDFRRELVQHHRDLLAHPDEQVAYAVGVAHVLFHRVDGSAEQFVGLGLEHVLRVLQGVSQPQHLAGGVMERAAQRLGNGVDG